MCRSICGKQISIEDFYRSSPGGQSLLRLICFIIPNVHSTWDLVAYEEETRPDETITLEQSSSHKEMRFTQSVVSHRHTSLVSDK